MLLLAIKVITQESQEGGMEIETKEEEKTHENKNETKKTKKFCIEGKFSVI